MPDDLADESLPDDEDIFSRPRSLRDFIRSEPVIKPSDKERNNLQWRPLQEFLSKFLGLKELIWASSDQIPRCILDVLHTELPKCLLHVNTFSLRSLCQRHDNLHDIDRDEYLLASSPSLASICAASTYFDTEGDIYYNEDAILQIAIRLAPNLRSGSGFREAIRSPRPPWRGFFGNTENRDIQLQGRLTKLSFHSDGFLNLDQLYTWARHVDFSALCSLNLSWPDEIEVSQAVTQMAENGIFKRLRKLSFVDHDIWNKKQGDCSWLLGRSRN